MDTVKVSGACHVCWGEPIYQCSRNPYKFFCEEHQYNCACKPSPIDPDWEVTWVDSDGVPVEYDEEDEDEN